MIEFVTNQPNYFDIRLIKNDYQIDVLGGDSNLFETGNSCKYMGAFTTEPILEPLSTDTYWSYKGLKYKIQFVGMNVLMRSPAAWPSFSIGSKNYRPILPSTEQRVMILCDAISVAPSAPTGLDWYRTNINYVITDLTDMTTYNDINKGSKIAINFINGTNTFDVYFALYNLESPFDLITDTIVKVDTIEFDAGMPIYLERYTVDINNKYYSFVNQYNGNQGVAKYNIFDGDDSGDYLRYNKFTPTVTLSYIPRTPFFPSGWESTGYLPDYPVYNSQPLVGRWDADTGFIEGKWYDQIGSFSEGSNFYYLVPTYNPTGNFGALEVTLSRSGTISYTALYRINGWHRTTLSCSATGKITGGVTLDRISWTGDTPPLTISWTSQHDSADIGELTYKIQPAKRYSDTYSQAYMLHNNKPWWCHTGSEYPLCARIVDQKKYDEATFDGVLYRYKFILPTNKTLDIANSKHFVATASNVNNLKSETDGFVNLKPSRSNGLFIKYDFGSVIITAETELQDSPLERKYINGYFVRLGLYLSISQNGYNCLICDDDFYNYGYGFVLFDGKFGSLTDTSYLSTYTINNSANDITTGDGPYLAATGDGICYLSSNDPNDPNLELRIFKTNSNYFDT